MNPSKIDPQRPRMPTEADQARAEHQYYRWCIMLEDFDEVIEEWIETHVGEDRAQIMGVPDTSANPLADLSRQLSTPGLYGRPATFRAAAGDDGAGESAMAGPAEQAGYSRRMPFVQYLTLGVGDMLLRWTVTDDGRMACRLVPPHNVHAVGHSEDESRPVAIWELQQRVLRGHDVPSYVWVVYDIADPEAPSYRIHLALAGGDTGGLGEEVTHLCLEEPPGYPWRGLDGRPVLPWSWYKDADTGQLWNVHQKRGAHRGTLNACLYWTYAGHCARDATGSYVIVAGLVAGGGVQAGATAGRPGIRSKTLSPGAVEYHDLTDGVTQPFVHEVGPGANLPNVQAFADAYEMKQAVRWGLNPTDLSRASANPSSAAALMVSNQGKREFAAQVEPVFRAADLQTARVVAIVARVGGLGTFAEDEGAYTVEYAAIPLSAAEKRARREELAWSEERGLASPLDTYRALHPGTSEDDALAAVTRAAVDRQRLDLAIREALAAADGAEGRPARDPSTLPNGAQASTANETITAMNRGELSPAQAKLILITNFGFDAATADSITAPAAIPPKPVAME